MATPAAVPAAHPRRANGGFVVMTVAVVAFSTGSSVVKWGHVPGAVVAFWRMVLAGLVWFAIVGVRRVRTGRPAPARAVWRAVLPAGLCYGANITLFFLAVTHTSIAHAEFITALSPLVLVPLGAVLFHERPNPKALPFGVLTLAGLAVVLLNGAPGSPASWYGDALVIATLVTWVGYLTTGRRARAHVNVIDFMATLSVIGLLFSGPAAAIQAGDALWPLDARAWAAVVFLTLVTGVGGHGLIAVAQRRLDVGVISVFQVAQPALAVVWAMVLLGEEIAPLQVPGMVLVLAGLVGFTLVQQRRSADPAATVEAASGELTGSVG